MPEAAAAPGPPEDRLAAVEAASLPHRATLRILGVPVRFRSDDPRVIDLALDAFGPWSGPGGGAGSPPAGEALPAPVDVAFAVRPGGPGHPVGAPPPPRHRVTPPHRILFDAGATVALADPDRRRGLALVDEAWLAHPLLLRHHLLEAVTLAVVTPLDRQPIHAAAVEARGTILVLAAPGGTGKSTLAWAAAAAGFRLVSEDTVYLQCRPRFRVWGAPGPVHLPPDQARRFPGLDVAAARAMPNGKTKVRAEPAHATRPSPSGARAVPVLLRRGASDPGLTRLAPDEVARALTADLDPGFDLFADTLGEPVSLLARGGGWRLDLPPDPRDAVEWLWRVVGESAGGDG